LKGIKKRTKEDAFISTWKDVTHTHTHTTVFLRKYKLKNGILLYEKRLNTHDEMAYRKIFT